MPIIEQLLIGPSKAATRTGRGILARSPGISREITTEIARLCEGWGQVPTEGLLRPVLISLPLATTLATLSGRLFAVLRISRGMDPFYHAVILSQDDYKVFGYNPFVLAATQVFLDEYTPDVPLIRGELANVSSTYTVSPSPSASDVDFVDEALRHVLANGKLLLPLETADERSDRFFALAIAALPDSVKRDLRFATWTSSEVNNWTLAAVASRGGTFEGWQRYLMTSVCGKLPAQTEQYIQSVRNYLVDGDADGLEKFSHKGKVDLKFSADVAASPRRGVLTSTVKTQTGRRSVSSPPRPAIAAGAVSSPNTAFRSYRTLASAVSPPDRIAPVRKGIRRKRGRRYGRTLVAIFALALVLSGGAMLLHQSDLIDLGWWRAEGDSRPEGSLLGVVDVGRVYDELLTEWTAAGLGSESVPEEKRGEKLTALQERAGAPLHQQGVMFVQLAGEGIQQIGRSQREQQRLEALAQRGAVLEQELRRLVLGYYSLNEGAEWRDLGRLSDAKLTARWDSLKLRRSSRLQTAQRGLRIEGLLGSVRQARVQVDATLQMIVLLEEPRCDERWTTLLHQAAEAAPRGVGTETDLYRGAARAVVQLKRAEARAEIAELPYAGRYPGSAWPPAGVELAVVAVAAASARFPRGAAPELLPAAAAFYGAIDTLGTLADRNDIAGQSAWLQALAENAAVRSDPAMYGDHVERARLELASALIGRGIEPATIPDRFFPGERRDESLVFLQALNERPDAAHWEQIAAASDIPFFVRWANREADRELRAARLRTAAFDESWDTVTTEATKVRRLAAAGENWSAAYGALHQALARLQAAYSAEAASDSSVQARWLQAKRLVAALAGDRTLAITSVTVRLEQNTVTATQAVTVELAAKNGAWRMVSDPFVVGPAAPAGSGWVGTGPVAWAIPLLPDQAVVARVLAADGSVLATANYAALRAGEGPGAMSRPRGDVSGSVDFQIDAAFWRQLALPPL